MEKNSFVLHADIIGIIGDLDNSELGAVFRAILHHENGLQIPPYPQKVEYWIRALFAELDRNREKYQERCEKNRENVSKRYNHIRKLRTYTNATDTDTDTVTDDSVYKKQNQNSLQYLQEKNPADADGGAGEPAAAPRGYTFTNCNEIAKRARIPISQEGLEEFYQVNSAHNWELNGEPLNVLRALRGFLKNHQEYKTDPEAGADPAPKTEKKIAADPEDEFYSYLAERIPDTSSGREIKKRFLADELEDNQIQQVISCCIGFEDLPGTIKKYLKKNGFFTLKNPHPKNWGKEKMREAFPDIDFSE